MMGSSFYNCIGPRTQFKLLTLNSVFIKYELKWKIEGTGRAALQYSRITPI
jgi:hypothetical protein